jgi:hypothetical protein
VLPRLRPLLDRESSEQRAPVFARLLHEAAQRRKVHGLAEAARAREEQDRIHGGEHARDEVSLVDVVDARLPQIAEVGEADRDPGRTGGQRRERDSHRGAA